MLADQPRQVQRAGQSRGTRANDQHIRFELFALNAYLPASTITTISKSGSSFSHSMAISRILTDALSPYFKSLPPVSASSCMECRAFKAASLKSPCEKPDFIWLQRLKPLKSRKFEAVAAPFDPPRLAQGKRELAVRLALPPRRGRGGECFAAQGFSGGILPAGAKSSIYPATVEISQPIPPEPPNFC